MIIKNTQIQHDLQNIDDALGFSKETIDMVNEKIMFCTFSNALIVIDNYDEIEKAPTNIRTVSGDLEFTLKMINTQEEYEYALFKFMNIHEYCMKCFKRYLASISDDLSDEDRSRLTIVTEMEKLRAASEGDFNTYRNPSNAIKRINYVKRSGYNFEKYLMLVEGKKITDGVDELLTKALKGE